MIAKRVLRQENFVPIFAGFGDEYRFQKVRENNDTLVRHRSYRECPSVWCIVAALPIESTREYDVNSL